MSWNYDFQNLSGSSKDQVRLAIGDTLDTDPQLQDEEIVQFIAGRSNLFGACADACRSLASKYSRSVTYKAGDTGVNYSDLAKAYLKMALGFDAQSVRAGAGMPYAGGISVADKQSQEMDTDRVQPQFNIGMEDNEIIPVSSIGNETQPGTTSS